MQWQSIAENWVLVPAYPKAVIHFLGGAFLAAAPQVSYSRLLENLARQGFVIIATPFLNNSFDHQQIAEEVFGQFQRAYGQLFLDYLPVFGMGHSMGCKIHLIQNCLFAPDRAGNIFIAYNNYSAKRSIPFFRELGQSIPDLAEKDFIPTPDQLNSLIADRYNVPHNLLIKFVEDDIDQIPILANLLQYKFGKSVSVQSLPGNHLTSMGVEVKWQPGKSFSPLDALGQWIKQEVHRDNDGLERVLIRWMAPQKTSKLSGNP